MGAKDVRGAKEMADNDATAEKEENDDFDRTPPHVELADGRRREEACCSSRLTLLGPGEFYRRGRGILQDGFLPQLNQVGVPAPNLVCTRLPRCSDHGRHARSVCLGPTSGGLCSL